MNLHSSAGMILLGMTIWGGLHSLLASQGAKDQAKRWFGSRMDRSYRLWYNLFSILSFLPVLASVLLLPDRTLYVISLPWLLLTFSFQVAAVLAILVGLRQTGLAHFLGWEQLRDNQEQTQPQLIVGGLYRWVRHPLYSAGLVFIWFSPVMTSNILALNVGMTIYLLIGAWFEERRLRREFGEQYVIYCQQTPMLVPRLTNTSRLAAGKEG